MKKQDGFTLLEVVVSMLLFTIGVLGMMGLQVLATRGAVIGNNNTVENYLAQSLASQLGQLTMNDPALSVGSHGYGASTDACLACANCNGLVDATGQCIANNQGNIYQVSWVVKNVTTFNSGTANNLKSIAITISWANGSFSLTIPATHY
jgi:type IV pilus assembly protein PilV